MEVVFEKTMSVLFSLHGLYQDFGVYHQHHRTMGVGVLVSIAIIVSYQHRLFLVLRLCLLHSESLVHSDVYAANV